MIWWDGLTSPWTYNVFLTCVIVFATIFSWEFLFIDCVSSIVDRIRNCTFIGTSSLVYVMSRLFDGANDAIVNLELV